MEEPLKKETIGACGEELVAKYLKSLGWRIIARNHKTLAGEIDIVAREPGGALVIVEVKTLSGNPAPMHRLMPEEHLNAHKLSKLRALGTQFANRYPKLVHEKFGWRIDLVAVNLTEDDRLTTILKDGNLRHYENL